MGAPGVYDWRGSVVRYIRSNTYNAATNNYNVDAIEPLTSEDTSSYFGYAVTTGYFKPKKLLYVASAPRGNSLKGKVLIFDFNESKEFLKKTIIVHKIFFGVQIGEYFGYTLLSDDFNKDGLVDLVISAPLHSRDSSFDNGMVYVYQNNNNMTFLETKPLVSNYITNGRFGMSLGKIGDVDQDGFNDLAVGAPFEDDGAVYIFHGSQYGLLSKPSQRIVPTPADQPLTFGGSYMFGMSISRGIDIDGNGFNDITIGAPNAELVYIYKSYPAINIISSIQSVAKEIELNATEFTIKACWRYYSKMIIPFNIKLIISIILDYESERVKFSINDTNELQFTDSIKTNDECREYNVSLTFSTADIFKPVVLEMSYDLDTKISHSSNFCKECVVIHPNDPKIVKNKVSISTGCKNIVCIADLRIRNSFNVVIDPYVIGSTKTILIWYFIENLGETAFSTQINISVPHIVTFSTIPTNCKLYGSSLRCELGKEWALYNGQQENISIVIDTSEIYGKQLKITSKVSSSGNESNADDNMIENTIHLKEFSEIEINGKSTLPSDSINVDSARLSNITHSLQIRNGGPSNIKQMMINFYIPLVYFIRGENKKKIKLIENENIVSKALYNNKQLNILSDISKKYHTTHNNTFLNFDSNFQNVPINRSIIFNCEDKNVYACLKGTVHVQDFKAKNTPINIEITFSIDLSQIDKLYSDKKSLFVLITSSEIIKDDDDGNTMNITKFNPYTVFKQSIPDTPIWIYVVSILAGTLGLILMYYALYKMGFFRRKTNEHMENVKIQREIQNLE